MRVNIDYSALVKDKSGPIRAGFNQFSAYIFVSFCTYPAYSICGYSSSVEVSKFINQQNRKVFFCGELGASHCIHLTISDILLLDCRKLQEAFWKETNTKEEWQTDWNLSKNYAEVCYLKIPSSGSNLINKMHFFLGQNNATVSVRH